VRYRITDRPTITIIVPTAYTAARLPGAAGTLVERCIESILAKTTYKDYAIIVLDNAQARPALARAWARAGIERMPYRVPFNWAAAMNIGAASARGDHLLFLNDDTEVITPDWLECMLEYSQQPGVGAVGAKLLFPGGQL